MNRFTYLLIFIASVAFASCQANHNGDYLIYNSKPAYEGIFEIDPMFDNNKDIEDQLRNAFIGKKFNCTFKEDYVILHCLNGNTYDNIILNYNNQNADDPYYFAEKMIGSTKFQFRLLKNESNTLILGIDCIIPTAKPIVVPVQMGAWNRVEPYQTGKIVCWLKKID